MEGFLAIGYTQSSYRPLWLLGMSRLRGIPEEPKLIDVNVNNITIISNLPSGFDETILFIL